MNDFPGKPENGGVERGMNSELMRPEEVRDQLSEVWQEVDLVLDYYEKGTIHCLRMFTEIKR